MTPVFWRTPSKSWRRWIRTWWLRASGSRRNPPSLTPAAVADLSLVGAALLARTPMTPTQFSSTMAEQFSDLPGINMMLLFMASSAELEHRLRTLERERQCHLRRAHAAIHKFELTVASLEAQAENSRANLRGKLSFL